MGFGNELLTWSVPSLQKSTCTAGDLESTSCGGCRPEFAAIQSVSRCASWNTLAGDQQLGRNTSWLQHVDVRVLIIF